MSDIGEMKRLVVIRQQLMDAGVVTLQCEYSGSGDSGQLDGIVCTLTETNPVTGAVVLTERVELKDVRDVGKDEVLRAELEELFWDRITQHHAGWENNDGGEGVFKWTLATDELKYTHHDFYLERHTTEHEGW